MSATPLPPPGPDGAMALPPPPGTDMTGICFRDQLWLDTYPLDRNLVFDYFALSPFYDITCNNESLRSRQIHPLDMSHLTKMIGMEYLLSEVMEPHLFVIRKQKRESPEKSNPMLAYYILDGSIYQAPQLCNVFASRISRSMHHISKAFTIACSKLEKIGNVETESDAVASESKTQKEAIDLKELKRIDHIMSSLIRKIGAAPPPPPYPEGYVPPSTEQEKGPDDVAASEATPQLDPIIDQGAEGSPAAKRTQERGLADGCNIQGRVLAGGRTQGRRTRRQSHTGEGLTGGRRGGGLDVGWRGGGSGRTHRIRGRWSMGRPRMEAAMAA